MRPLELRLSGFRSYRAERIVPFRDMDIVAIIGDTGAGKSSLLEAMTWALYGASTWSKKSSTDLLAHGARRMTVALEFEAAGERWLITRSFARSGGGTCELVCLSDPAAHPKVDGVRQVDPAIEQLLGLPYDVFCSCVLLPQGKFERLLKATKGEKTETLKSILRLEQLGVMRERADQLARQLGEREREVLTARGRFLPGPVEIVEAAVERLTTLTPERRRLDSLQAEVTRLAEAGRAHLERAGTLTGDAARLAERRGERSVQLRALSDHDAGLRTLLADELQARAAAELERQAAEAAAREAADAGLDASALMSARGGLNQISGLLASRAELATRIAGDERGLNECVARVTPARARVDVADRSLAAFDEQRALAASTATAAREQARRLAVAAEQASAATARHAAAASGVADAQASAQRASTGHEAARAALATATGERDRALAVRDAAQRANAVAHVAASCAPGDPCPVCERRLPDGFAPAHAPDLAAAEAALNPAQAAFQLADSAERDAAAMSARADASRAAAEQALEAAGTALAEALAKAQVVDPGAAAYAADREANQAESALAGLDAGRPALVSEQQEAAQAVTRLATEEQAARRTLGERRGDHERVTGELAAAVAALPTVCALTEATESAVAAAQAALVARLEAANALTKRVDVARQAEADATSAVHERELRLANEVTTPVAGLRVELQGLANELPDSALELAADPAKLVPVAEALEARVDERVADLRAEADAARAAEAADRAAREQALADSGFTGPTALSDRLDEVRAEIVTAERDRTRAQAQIEPVGRLDALGRRAADLRAGFDELKDALADSKFVGFVVARRQHALLQHASRVLQEITGRYAFTAEFQILDNESGLARSPDTLSGGETFIASLALALGLVEVADRSGGDLRALFLDEGFGTLDATILDTALTALEERAKAGRLIGLISHVPTVAERIDTVLEVRSALEGSTVHILDRDEREDRVMQALTADVGRLE